MGIAEEIAALFRRDLGRLIQELQAVPDERVVWSTVPGVTNSVGNLVLHLEGNLREYIGRQLGGIAYRRERSQEFAGTGLPVAELIARIVEVQRSIPLVIAALPVERMQATYPENVLGRALSTQQFLISLHGHFNYHLGQIDCLRRILTQGAAIELAGL